MNLGELIDLLREQDQEKVVRLGFGAPHSDRGDYSQLAFTPMFDASVRAMLASAESAVEATYEGWKGGSYTMHRSTTVWFAAPGESLDIEITYGFVVWMMEQTRPALKPDRVVGLAEAGKALIAGKEVSVLEGIAWKPIKVVEGGSIAYRETGAIIPLHVGSEGLQFRVTEQGGRLHVIARDLAGGHDPAPALREYGIRVISEAVGFLRRGGDVNRLEAEFLGAVDR